MRQSAWAMVGALAVTSAVIFLSGMTSYSINITNSVRVALYVTNNLAFNLDLTRFNKIAT